MKNLTLLACLACLFCLALSMPLFGGLSPQKTAPLYEHLKEVNHFWCDQNAAAFQTPVAFLDDRQRIQTHLRLVERILRNQPTTNWSTDQLQQRQELLDVLQDYWQANQFPINFYVPGRKQIFVDPVNTACAVGYLMRESGATELVDCIQTHANYATLHELLVYPEVPDWATQHGFTARELAWIQPGYLQITFNAEPLGTGEGCEGPLPFSIENMEVYGDELYVMGHFNRIDGFEAAHIAAWDGTDWRALPGLEPSADKVTRIAFDEQTDDLYAIGAFSYDTPGSLARYSNGVWQNIVDADDAVFSYRDLVVHEGKVYVAGQYLRIGNDSITGLIKYDIDTESFSPFSEAFTIEGAIYDMDQSGDSLAIAGEFVIMDDLDTLAQNFAVLDLSQHSILIDDIHIPATGSNILSVAIELNATDGMLDVAINYADQVEVGYYYFGQPYPFFFNAFLGANQSINHIRNGVRVGHLAFQPTVPPSWAIFGTGQSASTLTPITQANAPVTAMAYFQNKLILGGRFDTLDDQAIRHLASTDLLITNNIISEPPPPVQIASNGKTLFVSNLPPADQCRIELFDLQGRPVWQRQLYQLPGDYQLQPIGLSSGVYPYRLTIDDRVIAGKVVFF